MRRIRIGLRLMLLIVALFAVFFAWLGARRELQRVIIRGELESLKLSRQSTVNQRRQFTNEKAWRETMKGVEAEIEKRRKLLGEPNR
jgi:hypothetical protein